MLVSLGSILVEQKSLAKLRKSLFGFLISKETEVGLSRLLNGPQATMGFVDVEVSKSLSSIVRRARRDGRTFPYLHDELDEIDWAVCIGVWLS